MLDALVALNLAQRQTEAQFETHSEARRSRIAPTKERWSAFRAASSLAKRVRASGHTRPAEAHRAACLDARGR